MKGIRKLFLGLIFLTLFGVGFKVEAKADINLSLTGTPSSTIKVGVLIDSEGDFPKIEPKKTSASKTYTYNIESQTVQSLKYDSGSFTLKTTADPQGGDPVYTIESTEYDFKSTDPFPLKTLSKNLLREEMDKKINPQGIKRTELHDTIKATGKSCVDSSAVSLDLGLVSANAYYNNGNIPLTNTVTINNSISSGYLFPGEKAYLTSSSNDERYQFIKWIVDEEEIVGETGKEQCQVTMPDTVQPITADVYYGYLSIPSTEMDSSTSNTQTVTIAHSSDYDLSQDIDNVYVTKSDGSPATGISVSEDGSDALSISVEQGTAEDDYQIHVIMDEDKGGGDFTGTVTVTNGSTKLSFNDVFVSNGFTIPLQTFSTESPKRSVTVKATTTGAKYVNIYNSKKQSVAGIKTPLSNIYIYGKSPTSKTIDNALIITESTDTPDVTVFPDPLITVGQSNSSSLSSGTSTSSSESPLKVTMPNGVYHDDVTWDKVDRAYLEFWTSNRNTKWATLDMGSGSTQMQKTASVSLMGLTEIINELCSGDSNQTVRVRAYPMDPNGNEYDDDIYDDDQITAVKVTLDGSGGATYKINDKDMGESFYAVKGATYKITTSPKSGYQSTIDKWEGTSFGTSTSGSMSFSDSKTIKAIYKGGSSSSSSFFSSSSSKGGTGGSGGSGSDSDYDDVPKTGESKADIWILWSVLFVSIIGAGFMIYKRFGLARAIAETDREMEAAVIREEKAAKKKEKDDKLKMLKDLRNL